MRIKRVSERVSGTECVQHMRSKVIVAHLLPVSSLFLACFGGRAGVYVFSQQQEKAQGVEIVQYAE